jgi:hypothetical protein
VRGENPIDWITRSIIDSAMRIPSALGPGLFESVYQVVLERDLVGRGLRVERIVNRMEEDPHRSPLPRVRRVK